MTEDENMIVSFIFLSLSHAVRRSMRRRVAHVGWDERGL